MADNTFAAYLCAGCGLGDVLDLDAMEKIAKREGKMQVIKRHDMLCSAQGVQTIRNDIASEGVTHVMLGACSRRAKTEAFQFPETAMARANLREGVLWIVAQGAAHDEVRQEMADDYIRMGCAELKKMKVPAGNPQRAANKTILVVGGGVSGLTAAIEAAETGYEVVLVEKELALGGWAARLYRRVPFREPYAEPQATGLAELVARVCAHPRMHVHLGATLAQTAGAPGRFVVSIAQADGTVTEVRVGAIVQASGFSSYDMAKLPELGAGLPGVVDQAGLEALAVAAHGGPIRRADGQAVHSAVFVQCAGQRDESGKHLPYCSGHCCATSVKQAMYFKDANPDVDTAILYTDLRMPGMGEDFYRSAQSKGVTFTKGRVSQVSAQGSGCAVTFRDLILDEEVTVQADLVVLATGQVPNSGVNIDSPEAPQGDVKPISILNLNYRQGRDLPQLKAGLTDSHFICFPYETRRTGIYAAGPVRRPMDMLQATDDATGAALKAIQAVENAAQGRAAHPRSGDLSYPIVRLEGCTQCKRCTVE
ncbi:MAG: FAD-dependent oxidoreductase, partial [Betaproteobacteria bacterium]